MAGFIGGDTCPLGLLVCRRTIIAKGKGEMEVFLLDVVSHNDRLTEIGVNLMGNRAVWERIMSSKK